MLAVWAKVYLGHLMSNKIPSTNTILRTVVSTIRRVEEVALCVVSGTVLQNGLYPTITDYNKLKSFFTPLYDNSRVYYIDSSQVWDYVIDS